MIGLGEDCLTKEQVLAHFGTVLCPPNAQDFTCADANVAAYQLYLKSGLQNSACVLASDLPDLSSLRSPVAQLSMIPGGPIMSGQVWIAQLSGAAPNAPVTISGGANGNLVSQLAGNTDALGRKQLSGKFIDSQIGDWEQSWYVSGQEVGRLRFTVIPNPQIAYSAGTSTPGAGTVVMFGTPVGSPGAPLTAVDKSTGQQVSTSVEDVIPAPVTTVPGAATIAPSSPSAVTADAAIAATADQSPSSSMLGLALLAAGVLGFLLLGGRR